LDSLRIEKEAVSCQNGLRTVLVTAHRRESFGRPLDEICDALRVLVRRNGDIQIVYPVHLNPNVRKPVFDFLGATPRIHLIDPVPYETFVHLMIRSYLILTDSGGIQEGRTGRGETRSRPPGGNGTTGGCGSGSG
jgi:UDP-N-acetylglucosamine 2-epimerase (non-hydrolysing)